MRRHEWYTNRDTEIEEGIHEPSDDETENEWLDAPDIFRLSAGFHNGPECKRCGRITCHHCHREVYAEECPG